MIIDFLCASSYKYRSLSFSNQKLTNLYSENIETDASYTKTVKISTPGSTSAVSLPPNGKVGIRGMYLSSKGPAPDFNSRLYCAVGKTIYRVNEDFTYYALGTVGDNYTQIKFTDNGFDLCVTDGYSFFTCPLDAADGSQELTLTAQTMPYIAGTFNLVEPDNIIYLNGYIVINSKNTNEFFYSNIGATGAEDWDSTRFQQAEGSADKINALATRGGELWVFGQRSFEIYDVTSDEFTPFARVGGSFTEIGCGQQKSVAQISDLIFWLGSSNVGNNVVYMANGLTPVRISDNGLEHIIGKMRAPTDCTGFCYSEEGHVFYVLTFHTDDQTWVYDATTRQWHNRATRNRLLNINHKWNPLYSQFAYGKTYFGSDDSAVLLYLDTNKYDEWDGTPIVRELISPTYISSHEQFAIKSLQLDIEVGGTKVLVGQGSNPQIMLQVSKDGGYTWSNEKWRSLGALGKYTTRVKWHVLGYGTKVAFRFVISDPISVIINSIVLETENSGW
jgi:hypothetical protein